MAQGSPDDTLGAVLIGNLAAASLYGITVVQTYIYYERNWNDRLYLKLIVFILWVLDTFHMALVTHMVYSYAVTNFGDTSALGVPIWSTMAQIIPSGISDLIVRMVYCEKVWRLSNRNWFLSAAIVATSLGVFGGTIAFAARGIVLPSFAAFAGLSDLLYGSLGVGVLADVLIAGSMCVLLARRRTGFSRTDSIVRVLILYSINTGALMSLFAIICLISYATMPDNFIFIAFFFILPKIFLNSMLANMNARRTLREGGPSMVSVPLSDGDRSQRPLSDVSSQTAANSRPSRPGRSKPSLRSRPNDDQTILQIEVHTSTEEKTDPPEPYFVGTDEVAFQPCIE